MIWNKRIKKRNQNQDFPADMKRIQRFQKIKDTVSEETHLKKRIKRNGNDHVGSQCKTYLIEQLENHRVHKRVMVAVRCQVQNLFQLIDAVGRHNAGKLVQKIRKPAEQTAEKTIKRQMPAIVICPV